MSIGFVLALLAAPAGMPLALTAPMLLPEPTPRELREIRKQDVKLVRLCRRAQGDPDRLDRLQADVETLSQIAGRLWDGTQGCRKDRGLAIAVQRFAVGDGALLLREAETVDTLAYYLSKRADLADRAELAELEGILWVRGDAFRTGLQPNWAPEKLRAFIVREDIWAFLSASDTKKSWSGLQARLEALLDPLSPRYAPAEGVAVIEAGHDSAAWVRAARLLLDGAGLPRDAPRAEALLVKAAPYADEAGLLLAPMLAQRLKSSDAASRAAALQQYAPWSRLKGQGAAAIRAVLIPHYRAMLAAPVRDDQRVAALALTDYAIAYPDTDVAGLLRWIDAALHKGDEADKALGWRNLGMLTSAKTPGAEQVMNNAFARAGGLVDGGTLKAADLTRIITNDDYPARAIREEHEGVVESEVIITPEGRVLMVVVIRSPDRTIGDEVQKIVMRRLRVKNLLPVPGRYVRAKLPPVQFRIRPCPGEGEMTPAIEGALLVDGWCIPRPNLEFPIS